MRVRVISVRVAPAAVEELIDNYQANILPQLRQHQGFSSLMLLSDVDTGKVVELTLFDDEDALQESEEDGGVLEEKLNTLRQKFDAIPDVEIYDLKILS